MNDIIERLNGEKAELEVQIDANEHELAQLDERRTKLVAANEQAEETIVGIEAAVAVLGGKDKRRKLRRKK